MRKLFNFNTCVMPLLEVLGWRGHGRRIFEAVPPLTQHLKLIDLRNLMVNLGYASKSQSMKLSHLPDTLLPCLFVGAKEEVYVILKREAESFYVLDCKTHQKNTISRQTKLRGTIYHFYALPESEMSQGSWFLKILNRFRPLFYGFVFLSFLSAFLSLIPLIFVPIIFDQIIPSGSMIALGLLGGLFIFVLCCMYFVQTLQSRNLAYLNARLDTIVGLETFHHMIHLPMVWMEETSAASQISRLRQFEQTPKRLIASYVSIFLEGPFVLVCLMALFAMAGGIVVIPLFMILLLIVFAFSVLKYKKSFSVWAFPLSQLIGKIGCFTILIWGAKCITEKTMSIGTFLMVFLLTWKVLISLQKVCIFFSQFDEISQNLKAINRFMSLPIERKMLPRNLYSFEGLIRVQNVGFRYSSEKEPALQGVTLEAKPGEIIVITGPKGSGKTTFLKLLLGFYEPQAGAITIDGIDVRDLDSITLRQSIAYIAQENQVFQGTIAQNLQLAAPEITEAKMIQAAEEVGLLSDIMSLPNGFQTHLHEQFLNTASLSFRKKLNLARGYVRKTNILIMDEPAHTLDQDEEEILYQSLKEFRGKKTLILVTCNSNFIELADRILFLQEGTMRAFGPKDKILKILQEP